MLRFIDREVEIWQVREFLNNPPGYVLFVYGPKSSGKSTLMMKIARDVGNFVFYDFRARAPSNVADALMVPKPTVFGRIRRWLRQKITGMKIYQGVEVDRGTIKRVKAGELDPFLPLIPALKRMNYPVLVLDEVQALTYSGVNFKEIAAMLNFLVTLTKKMHLTHAVVVTSDCLFVENAVKLAALEEAAEFMFVGDLEKATVLGWMREEGMDDAQARRVWEVCGGRPYELWLVVNHFHAIGELDILDKIIARKKARIEMVVGNDKECEEILRKMAKKGKIKVRQVDRKILEKLIKEEIAFFDPIEGTIYPISQSTGVAIQQLYL